MRVRLKDGSDGVKIAGLPGVYSRMIYSDFRLKGKRVRKALSTDARFAHEKLTGLYKWARAQKEGSFDGDIPWKMFKEKFFEWNVWKKRNSRTHDRLGLEYLEETFPIQKLSEVTPELLERARSRWLSSKGQANHINRLVYAVKAAMRKAEEWRYIPPQNWNNIKPIKTTKARIYFWTIPVYSDIVKRLPEPYRTAMMIGGQAGFRVAETNNTTWDDVDFRLKRIGVTAKPDWQPKDYEKRWVPMTPQLEAHLKSLVKNKTYVLPGKRLSNEVLSVMINRHIKSLGYKGTSHTARHTFASHLVMSGVPVYTVSKLLGHASVRTTEEHYAHLAASHYDAEIRKMPALQLN